MCRTTEDNDLQYAASWIDQILACPASQSLPLQTTLFKRKACRGFFAGIMPEKRNRESLLEISARNDYSTLDRIARECPGAITFVSEEDTYVGAREGYRELTREGLVETLQTLPNCGVSTGCCHGVLIV